MVLEKLITRKEAARILSISLASLDAARNNGQIAYVQFVPNGCVFFTDSGLQEYVARCTHIVKSEEPARMTYRKPHSRRR